LSSVKGRPPPEERWRQARAWGVGEQGSASVPASAFAPAGLPLLVAIGCRVLPLVVEPDRLACRTLAARISCVSLNRPLQAERDGADATT
jgi:hypothetical protein